MHPNAQPLEEAQRQLSLLLQQQEELAPGLYRDLALYLQVLRDGLLPAVQQACFHLATQVVPERYKELPRERRQQFQHRLAVLVHRCSTLLTVEQLMSLAAQQHRRDQRRRASQRQRLMQALLDNPEPPEPRTENPSAPAIDSDYRLVPQPPGSIQLGLDLPVSADLFDAGIPGLPRPASEPAPEPSAAEMELQLMQSLFQMASAGLGQESRPSENPDVAPAPGQATGSGVAPAGVLDAAVASLDASPPIDPRVTASSLPRDPLLQWSWWAHFDRALTRRLRNLSHALNVEMMRLGLAQGLLPLNLLDGVLEGQVEALPAPANLLRLPLPLPGAPAPAEVLTVLLRPSDLEYEQPRLRTCRRRLEQRRRELRKMAGRYRVWQRRVVALEAEQQWFRDSAQSAQRQTPSTADQLTLEAWLRPLQQALQLEADRGFGDLQGRRETFSAFLARALLESPLPLPHRQAQALARLAEAFTAYASQDLGQRQSLVRRSRQTLHELQCALRPTTPPAPPRLRLLSESSPGSASGTGTSSTQVRALRPETPLSEVRGIGPKVAARLAALDLWLAEDLLRHYPRDYLDYANLVRIAALEPGSTATIVATVRRCHTFTSPRNPNLSILELQLADVTGRLKVSKFFAGKRFSSPGWLKLQQRQYPPGATVAVSGLVKETPYGPVFQDPLMEVLTSPSAPVQSEQIGRLLPVYGLTEGLTADRLRTLIRPVVTAARLWPDHLPAGLLQREQLLPLGEALWQIHRPSDRPSLAAARHRLVFDEFLLLQLGLLQRRRELTSRPAPPLLPAAGAPAAASLLQAFLDLLPFPLTGAQQRVLAEIRADLVRDQPMARLVQGDVGSGKTVVAIAALLTAIEAGCQGALMAPTEVLAEQHHRKLCEWLPQLHVSCALLTGSTPAKRRRELLTDLANGQLKLLVGTHALLEDPVQFARLGLVVVDEQHRFGVHQRNRLLDKGLQPHLLTMTATPIPRTLALSLHGDLEVSQIDELPPGRTPIRTRLLSAGQRQEAYDLIREQVALGQRAYVVLPLVEESEKLELRSAVEAHRHLSEEVFPELQVGLLHGRMTSADKQAAINAFACGGSQVLVSTTVVEVGVDVPAASVMLIEHADRFGLAQLHQLRGRVGRGAAASHCLLVNDSRNALARQRLEVLVQSTDGFEIAEMDLRLRGPGQVLGTRQSGLPDLALASLSDDGEVLEQARRVARELLEHDPELQRQTALAAVLAKQRQRLVQGARLN